MITTRPAPPIPAGLDALMQLVAFAQACLGPDLAGILADLDARQKAASDTLAQAQAERAAAKHAQDSALEATNLAAARVNEAEQKVLTAKALQVDAQGQFERAAAEREINEKNRIELRAQVDAFLAREAAADKARKAVELGLSVRNGALDAREKTIDAKLAELDEKIAAAAEAKAAYEAKALALKSALEG